jgi:hypothetical protein
MNRTRLLKLAKHSIPPSRGFTALGPAFALLLLGVSCSKVDPENNARLDKEALSAIPRGHHKRVCADATPGSARCHARVRTNSAGDVQSFTTPSGFGPAALQSAYLVPTGGAGQTVAIVDAYDDPYAESELATYRSQFGLPPCTTANGCFKKVNQNGATSPLPAADSGWSVEIALDLAMVSAICPSCNILLVEANSATMSDLGAAENAAAALGPAAISNSWGGSEYSDVTTFESLVLQSPRYSHHCQLGRLWLRRHIPFIEQVRARCRRNEPGHVHVLAWVGRVRLGWSWQRLQCVHRQAIAPDRPWVQQTDSG